ncbi:hypothetical protein FQR65_LT04844 [Abscondita terminalis]|nr:hypothetical protein FQR65_LT04844 [Abscondita terminalis]
MISNVFLFFAVYEVIGITVPERIKKNGYPIEIYRDIVTDDKYLLTMFRIPCGNPCKNDTKDRPPVLLMHGLFGSAKDYIVMGPERGLGFLLADRGYDVWLGNARGSLYSRKHTTLNPDYDARFWEFSWHEIGYYDVPAFVNLVKTTTNKNQISYVGNSMGTTVFFVLNSDRPEFNKDFNVMIALAPAAYLSHVKGPIVPPLVQVADLLDRLGGVLGINEVPPKGVDGLLGLLGEILCQKNSPLIDACRSILFLVSGFNPDQLNKSAVAEIYEGGPSPVSRQQLIHYAQSVKSGYFRHYDYGSYRNKQKYSKTEPPIYELNKVTVPVNIFYSDGDWLCNPQDVERLGKELNNCVLLHKVSMKSFSHTDFLFASDVVPMVYEKVFEVLHDVQTLINNEGGVSNKAALNWRNYQSLEAIYAWLKSLPGKHPQVTVIQGGVSYQGRPILGVKVSYKPGNKIVFLEGGIHAREWISTATVTFILNELLTSTNPRVRAVAESRDWYVFPSVNPDGYVFSTSNDRMWRKTRKPYGYCYGADPNRNWGYKWMQGGASSNPCADDYAGPNAFSEIETRSLSNFISSISANLEAYIGFHSYSQYILIPFSHSGWEVPANNAEQRTIGLKAAYALATRYGTQYKVGNTPEIIYVASGGSFDWVLGTYRHVRLAYTFELRDRGRYGFLLPPNQIIPTGQETLDAIVVMIEEISK